MKSIKTVFITTIAATFILTAAVSIQPSYASGIGGGFGDTVSGATNPETGEMFPDFLDRQQRINERLALERNGATPENERTPFLWWLRTRPHTDK
jgi:hypothetical protein